MSQGHVIIGNGGAALNAVKAIRSRNSKAPITMIAGENCPAYSPVLGPYYISGKIPWQAMFLCESDFYSQHNVEILYGQKAVEVDIHNKRVGVENGSYIAYENLLIATGSKTDISVFNSDDRNRIFTLWTAEDARRIKQAAAESGSVAIVGGGLIGFQAMRSLVKLGKATTLVEMKDHVMPTILDTVAAEILQEKIEEKGIRMLLGDKVIRIDDEKGKKVLALDSGEEIRADMVILATGILPNVDWLRGSGISIARGVTVDDHARTNVPGVYAAGDAAESPDPLSGNPRINAIWINAVEQGRTAGLNMAGYPAPQLRKARVNIFSLDGYPVASAGLVGLKPGNGDEICFKKGDGYRRLIFDQERLVGAIIAGDVEDIGILVNFMEKGVKCKQALSRSLGATEVRASGFGQFK